MSHIIKEEEAGAFICPIMTSGADGTVPVMCMGSKCMGWHFSRSEQTSGMKDEVVKRTQAKIKEHPELKGLDKVWKDEWAGLLAEIKLGKRKGFEETEGYCGLAGDPAAKLRA